MAGLLGSAETTRKLTCLSLVRIHSLPWAASASYCRSFLRGAIRVSGRVGEALAGELAPYQL